MHRTIAFLAAILLTTISLASAGFAASAGGLRFTIEPAGSSDRLELRMREQSPGRDSNWSSTIALAELRGLDPAQLRAAGSAPLSFALVREAGRFECRGEGGRSAARGGCSFVPDLAFAQFLASRGIGRPSRDQAYALAMSGIGRAHVEALAANRYPTPTVNQLVAMGIHGASPRFIQELAAAGYRLQSADDLVAFRIHGVDANYIRAIAGAGPQFRRLPAEDLVAFKIHGVSPELVGTYSRLGTRGLDRDGVLAMAIHGVTPRYIEDLARLGYRGLAADDLVKMRIFGVTADYIRSLQQAGNGHLPVDQMVQMRILGHGPRAR